MSTDTTFDNKECISKCWNEQTKMVNKCCKYCWLLVHALINVNKYNLTVKCYSYSRCGSKNDDCSLYSPYWVCDWTVIRLVRRFWIIGAVQFQKLRVRVKLIHGWLVQAVTFETDGGNPWRAVRWGEVNALWCWRPRKTSSVPSIFYEEWGIWGNMHVKYLLSPFCKLMYFLFFYYSVH